MNHIINFISTIFSYEWELQQILMFLIKYKSEHLKRITGAFFILSIVLSLIMLITKKMNEYFIIITFLVYMICIGTFLLRDSISYLTTTAGFIKSSFFFTGSVFLLVTLLIFFSSSISTYIFNNNWHFLIFTYIIFTVAWSLFSSFANAETASLINAIFTVVLGLINEFFNVIFKFIPDSLFITTLTTEQQQLLEVSGYTIKQSLEAMLSGLLFLPFVMLAVATIICASKSYWIKKHNNNHDINSELILDSETEKQLIYHFIFTNKNSNL